MRKRILDEVDLHIRFSQHYKEARQFFAGLLPFIEVDVIFCF
jgi:hypothetical protein